MNASSLIEQCTHAVGDFWPQDWNNDPWSPPIIGRNPSFKTMLCSQCQNNPLMVETMYGVPQYEPICVTCMIDLDILHKKEW